MSSPKSIQRLRGLRAFELIGEVRDVLIARTRKTNVEHRKAAPASGLRKTIATNALRATRRERDVVRRARVRDAVVVGARCIRTLPRLQVRRGAAGDRGFERRERSVLHQDDEHVREHRNLRGLRSTDSNAVGRAARVARRACRARRCNVVRGRVFRCRAVLLRRIGRHARVGARSGVGVRVIARTVGAARNGKKKRKKCGNPRRVRRHGNGMFAHASIDHHDG